MKSSKTRISGIAAFTAAICFLGFAVRADSATINYTGTGTLTYITAPGTSASQDNFQAAITDATYGAGTLSVPGDVTNGTGHAPLATFNFFGGSGTFFGTASSLLNPSAGAAVITYDITGGTGIFATVSGTIVENAQFTLFGSFSPNVPANVVITSATGTLSPERGTMATLALGMAGVITLARRRSYRG